MISTIVVPVDGSAASERLLPHVAELCRAVDAGVHLLHVTAPDLQSRLAGRDYLSGLKERSASLLPGATTVVRSGEPGVEIVRYASRVEAALIALGTRGGSALRRVMFGKTAIEILRSGRVRLYVARPEWKARPFRTILAAVDSTPESTGVLSTVEEFARGAGAQVRLLRVGADSGNRGRAGNGFPGYGGFRVHPDFGEGDPAAAILAAARESGADLIAVGTHGRRDTDRFFFGSVAESVLLGSDVPVLIRGAARESLRVPLAGRKTRP